MKESFSEEIINQEAETQNKNKEKFLGRAEFEFFIKVTGEENASEFFDLMGEENFKMYILHFGDRNGALFIYNSSPDDVFYFIKNMNKPSMKFKIIEASELVKGEQGAGVDAGGFVTVFRPEGAAILYKEYGSKMIRENMDKIISMKKGGKPFKDVTLFLDSKKA